MAPDRYRILPTTEVKQTIQRTVHAHTPRDVAVNMAEKEGIPALAPINQSDTDAQTINVGASIGNSICDAWRDVSTDGLLEEWFIG